jgi:hypothetical protein
MIPFIMSTIAFKAYNSQALHYNHCIVLCKSWTFITNSRLNSIHSVLILKKKKEDKSKTTRQQQVYKDFEDNF